MGSAPRDLSRGRRTGGARGAQVLLTGSRSAFLEALAVRLEAVAGIGQAHVDPEVEDVLAEASTWQVDVVLVAIGPETGGALGVITRVCEELPEVPVVVISMADPADRDVVAGSLLAGARGWVERRASFDELVRALAVVLDGGLWWPPPVLAAALRTLQSRQVAGPASSFVDQLTPREREVLDHLEAGRSRPEIAAAMSLSPETVRTHVQHILKKAHVHSALAALAKAHGSTPASTPRRPRS
jgi:DNA-binding NarL/FixJ family response regulator